MVQHPTLNTPSTNPCHLARLGSWPGANALPSLDISREGTEWILTPRANEFPCCQGSGLAQDSSSGAMRRCDLHRRIAMTRSILEQYQRTWSSHGVPVLPPLALDDQSWRGLTGHLTSIARGDRPRGIMRMLPPPPPGLLQPGTLWTVALMATWRFGIRSHMVSLGRTPGTHQIPSLSGDAPGLVLVEGVDRLWQPERVAVIEALVSYAYRIGAVLWIEVIQSPATEGAKPAGSVSQSVARRVSGLTQKPVWSWLSPDIYSKLHEVCVELPVVTPRQSPMATRRQASARRSDPHKKL